MALVSQVSNGATGSVARGRWNTAIATVETDTTITGDGTVATPLSIQTELDLVPKLDGSDPFTGLNVYSNDFAITADSGSIQGGSPLTKELNVITTCVTIGDSVTLPTAIAGIRLTIVNNGATSSDVFPASGATINGAGVNIAEPLTNGSSITYIATSTTSWLSA